MSEVINSTLGFLHSQVDWENVTRVSIEINKDGILFNDDRRKPYDHLQFTNNPIQEMISHITEEMCVECLQIDYLFKDPFFLSLTKAYIECLFIQYGDRVSISKEMMQAFLLNNLLGKHSIECHTLDDVVLITLSNYKEYSSESCIYKLVQ